MTQQRLELSIFRTQVYNVTSRPACSVCRLFGPGTLENAVKLTIKKSYQLQQTKRKCYKIHQNFLVEKAPRFAIFGDRGIQKDNIIEEDQILVANM